MILARAFAAAALFATLHAWSGEPAQDAARLATLVERVGKLHVQAGQDIAAERARRALAIATRDFDRQLRAAASGAPAAMREHYALFALLWRQHRAWLAKPAAREQVRALVDRADELAWLADRGQRLAGEPAGAAGDAWHAARLSQRVVRLALLRRWSRDEALARGEHAALEELRERLGRVHAATGGDAAVQAEVAVAENQLPFLARALDEEPTARSLDVAARSADNMLESLERALARIEAAGAPLSASPG
jgi:hypothetical protein